MRDQIQKQRLKGLDEMPRRRRTLRQIYFRFRAMVLGSKHFSWVWPFLKVTLWVLLFWLVARLTGFPIERFVRKIFAGISEFR